MRRRSLLALAALSALALALLGAARIDRDLSRPRDLHQTAYATSNACRSCHPDHYRSWARTFHRTMTEDASPASVLGDFAGASLRYGGVRAELARDASGGFVMRLGSLGRARVVRTVGSHRYQQYLAQEGDVLFRLPLAWHVEERRWIHMNGAFLTPDPPEPAPGGSISRIDYDRHVTRWNDNCVFCHNVAPRPGLRGDHFQTQVAELGVACEACHGPGSEHVAQNADPLRRYALHASDRPDPTIVNPRRLSAAASAQVCGRCHGQRISSRIERFLRDGDPFVPGDDLARYSRPLARTTTLHGEPAFSARFWPDGTARLTAYEYQGLLQSPCAGLTCTSCHGMHEGDPRGQLRARANGDGACLGCHAQPIATPSHLEHHSVRCVDCHMPRVVYGLLDVHRSHRIEIPRRGLDRPDACALCHADEGSRVSDLLIGGDPIERAVAASALGRTDAMAPQARPQRLGLLLDAMEHDAYPAVRWIAWRSARSLSPRALDLSRYDSTAPASERRAIVEAARRATHAIAPDAGRTEPLRARAAEQAIEIGE